MNSDANFFSQISLPLAKCSAPQAKIRSCDLVINTVFNLSVLTVERALKGTRCVRGDGVESQHIAFSASTGANHRGCWDGGVNESSGVG